LAARAFARGVLPAHLGLLPSSLLALGVLPASQFLTTAGVLAIPLIPASGPKDVVAALPQTALRPPAILPNGTGFRPTNDDTLDLSQGR
jgi:hypothetical protein